ncbi:mucin-7-like [Arachis ipaensis]|uniref:mucin-7-like n=1 Tax=Arachis ipaensis TaxID=130454 RepID=UPI0007AF13AE|nr:mucin-7-like [Arachis ipaensis]
MWEMLDEIEQAFVTVLEDLWREPPHLDTKKSLGDPSLVRTALEMAKNNNAMKAFKKARKAAAAQNISAKTDGEGSSQVTSKSSVPSSPGPRRMIPTPRVRVVDPPQSSAAAASSPPVVPPSKRPRTVEPFNLDAPDFDTDGKIVPDDSDDDVVEPPVPTAKISAGPTSSAPSSKTGHSELEPDCQILNRDDGTMDAVPLQTRPPSPRAAEKTLDPQ